MQAFFLVFSKMLISVILLIACVISYQQQFPERKQIYVLAVIGAVILFLA